MKLFSKLLLLFALLAGLTNANELQPKITPDELGYTDTAYITYFEQIDDNYLGLTVEYEKDGYSASADWVYNLKTKEAKNITYTDEQGREFWIDTYEYHMNPQHGLRYFQKEGGWIYTIVSSHDGDGGNYLLATHLITGEQNIRLIRSGCPGFMGLLQAAEKNFIVETKNCREAFKLFAFDNSTLSEVWSVQDLGWESFTNYENQIPFYHKEKIYLSAHDKLYAFNTSNYKVDTIIEDTRDTDGVTEGCVSVPTQYFAHGDDVYIVYNDVSYFTLVITYAMNAEGNTRIWKTDGTKSGTTLIKSLAKTERYQGVLTNSKLFSLDSRLLWLGDMDTTVQSEIYEVKGKDFEPLGKINFINNNIAGVFYNVPFRHAIPLFNTIQPVRFEHQDVLVYTEIVRNSESNSDVSSYLNVVGIEGNQVKQYLANYPIDPIGDQWSYREYRCWNIGERLTVFRHEERNSEDLSYHSTFLDFLVSDSYKDIDFEIYSPMVEGSWGLLSIINAGNEVLFGASDKEGKNFIIWSWDGAKTTSVKNYPSGKELDWTIYPNPTSHTFAIQSTEYLSGNLMIIGTDGKIHQTLRVDGHQKQIDVSKLPNGMYVAVYQGNSYIDTQTFIIQR
ncbi:MAG TPA: T9SS type A sorting domain-containing protein [Chitinophagales bacterium]|nr:T9SS type A sorting domain-containing protein [Chitinophagales bacterium]